ncbi:MAG: hypothetical protein IJ156_02185 [Bacteroidales bacterium]|nr:hypothetical protein [Bacteroidales bacterium]
MRKFLEVLVDGDGKFHFSTDESFQELSDPRQYDKQFKRLLQAMTEFMWENPQQKVSAAVRLLSMAEMLGCSQPYDQAEEFWSAMMFHAIPQYEDFAARIKRPYGFDDRAVVRPIVHGDTSFFSPSAWQFPLGVPVDKDFS